MFQSFVACLQLKFVGFLESLTGIQASAALLLSSIPRISAHRANKLSLSL